MQVPRLAGRLQAADLGLVINLDDPASVAVGAHYIAARGLSPKQVLRLRLPVRPVLDEGEFNGLVQAIQRHFGPETQALALAWNAPYAVGCNALTGALTLGYDGALCRNSCGVSRVSRYFNHATHRPQAALGLRPAMLLAAPSVPAAIAMIDRGVASDGQLALRGRPPVTAQMLLTDDAPRRVRTVLYPPPGLRRSVGVDVQWRPASELPQARRVLVAITGSVQAPVVPSPDWVPGGLGDHLTSYGGDLLGTHGQGTALDWIASGATASHGSVSEPCNHLQKFPHPQVLLGHYAQGATAIEAYWKSVAWPQQSLFIGEPLAAPFSPRSPGPVPQAPRGPSAPSPAPALQPLRPAPPASAASSAAASPARTAPSSVAG
ncbi:TIGR03790 family protein [Rubrivivax rivuli]|uniref:TIGR03790 family protein n=1 Tax=Rubrivivax rivuli TaxID=1862385 RepID=UPI001FDFF6A8|nr:TIGR03790 family protein [Rubrivivax rivuli]